MAISTAGLSLGAALFGLVSHVCWFIRGEHDLLSRQYCLVWLAVQTMIYFYLTRVAGLSMAGAAATGTAVSLAYLGALFSSILVYRVFFHRLRHFPGPLSWRMTKMTQMVNNLDAKGYKHLDELHKKYGKVVRTGPNEVSIIDAAAAPEILGPRSKCSKAIWYDVGKPLVSVHQCRDKRLHDIRRRIWDKGFNAKSLRDYDSRVQGYTDLLMKQLRAYGGGALNASKWFNYYSFDVMGDLAFGESFHMLEKGESHFAIPLLQAGMDPMNVIPAVPWLFYVIAVLPILSDPYWKFINWSGDQAEKRKKMKVSEPDIMSHLIEAEPMSATDEEVNRNWQVGDARLIIVAGSDTTAATLSYCCAELIRHPHVIEKLRNEVAPYVSNDGSGHVDPLGIQKCDYLTAVIDEGLRLHPPVPSGLMRITPPEGITVSDTYIPGNTSVIVPLYSLQRSSEAYERPDDFVPERWTTQPELVKQRGAWAPFSLGAFGCVGRQLAYMEIRTVLARLVTDFDLAFAPAPASHPSGVDGKSDTKVPTSSPTPTRAAADTDIGAIEIEADGAANLFNNSEDHFTVSLADMWIQCKPRRQGGR